MNNQIFDLPIRYKIPVVKKSIFKNDVEGIFKSLNPEYREKLIRGLYIDINDTKICPLVRAIYNMKTILASQRGILPSEVYTLEAIDNINVDTFKNLGLL